MKMDARNAMILNVEGQEKSKNGFNEEDKIVLNHLKFAQGVGASLRYANELRAVQQVGRLPFLKSSNLHEDVLRGKLGPGNGFKEIFGDQEEKGINRFSNNLL